MENEVKAYIYSQAFDEGYEKGYQDGRQEATVDADPVIHAHWTRKRTLSHDGELYCSNCEWTPEVLGGTTFGDLQLADVYYCPHCCAKMDEEVENE